MVGAGAAGHGVREDHPRARRHATSWSATSAASCTRIARTSTASCARDGRAHEPARAAAARANDALRGRRRRHRRLRARARSPPRRCARWPSDAIVFAMANPTPEVQPEEVWDDVAIMATGRSDYPNQINNVLAFPGIFRGALDVRARGIDEAMKLAAARAIAARDPGVRPRARVHRPERLQPRRRARGGRGGGARRRSSRASPAATVPARSRLFRPDDGACRSPLGADDARGLVVDLDEAQVVVGDLLGGGLAVAAVEEAPSARPTRSSGRSRSR